MDEKQYLNSLIYNLDETSLVIKNHHRPAVVCREGMCTPAYHPNDPIFSCTAVFVVCADGGHCPSTLILNSKAKMEFLKNFVRDEIDVRCECFQHLHIMQM
jgi:hypothetical protein